MQTKQLQIYVQDFVPVYETLLPATKLPTQEQNTNVHMYMGLWVASFPVLKIHTQFLNANKASSRFHICVSETPLPGIKLHTQEGD
jgi:hypothetical protein